MKIEFEIDEKETILLLDVIKGFMGQTGNPKVLKALSKIVTEIESDLKVGDEVFKRLRFRLAPYSNGNKILPESNMKIHLGINENFLTRPGGLEQEASYVLKNIVLKYMPEYDIRKLTRIPLPEIKKCNKVLDVVSLIQSNYEKL
tara:strand:- start:39905 stop:40339 length:435 start_codon:yes stop_codon:yes gene_type:complete